VSILDMEITSNTDPERIRNRNFARVRKGYDPDQVHDYLRRVADAMEQLEREVGELRHRPADAESTAPAEDPYGALATRVADVLRTAEQHGERVRVDAEEEAHRVLSDARQEAARIRHLAQQDAEGLRQRAEEESQRIRASADEALQSARDEAGRMLTMLSQRRHHLVTELHSTRERLMAIVDQLEETVRSDEPVPPGDLTGPTPGIESELRAAARRSGLLPPEPGPGKPPFTPPPAPSPPAPPQGSQDVPPSFTPAVETPELDEGHLDERQLDDLLEGATTFDLVLPDIPSLEDETDERPEERREDHRPEERRGD
jgi:DivIVA domain-containing protein